MDVSLGRNRDRKSHYAAIVFFKDLALMTSNKYLLSAQINQTFWSST